MPSLPLRYGMAMALAALSESKACSSSCENAVATRGLGLVQRHVGTLHHGVNVVVHAAIGRDADAGRDADHLHALSVANAAAGKKNALNIAAHALCDKKGSVGC